MRGSRFRRQLRGFWQAQGSKRCLFFEYLPHWILFQCVFPEEGKRKVSQNALKHGLTAKQVVIFDEDPNDFDDFRDAIWKDLNPCGAREELLAEAIIVDAWRLKRIRRLEAAVYTEQRAKKTIESLDHQISSLRPLEPDPLFDPLAFYSAPKRKPVDAETQQKIDELLEERRQVWLGSVSPTFDVIEMSKDHARYFDNLARREATLRKSLSGGLHELERLQMRRAGEQVAAPAVVDVDVHVRQDGAEDS